MERTRRGQESVYCLYLGLLLLVSQTFCDQDTKLMLCPGSALGGMLSSKRNLAFYTLTVGSAFTLLGSGLLYSIGFDRSIVHRLYGFEVILGFGIGLIFSSSTVFIKLYADIEDAGTSIIEPARNLQR